MAGKKSSTTAQDDRARNWTFLIYEDSAPENWRQILDDNHMQWIESPWHDKDINADGSPKKKHKHIALSFDGKKSFEQIKAITDSVHSPIPQRCQDLKGLVRYMSHLDNPEKAQYDVGGIIGHGGADVANLLRPTSSQRLSCIRDMMSYVKEHDVTEFQDLCDYAAAEHYDDWFPLLADSCSYIMGQYIKSLRHRRRYITVDPDTGEVIDQSSHNKKGVKG